MPDFTFRIEDTSPFITYSGNWRAGSTNDEADQYSESSFMMTNTNGSSMTFTFYGTQVEINGALRRNHGKYRAVIDGEPSIFNGYSNEDAFQSRLVYMTNLELAQHTIQLENLEDKYLDVDYISWTTRIGGNESVDVVTVQEDRKDYFGYSGFWVVPKKFSAGTFFGGSGLATSVTGSSVKLQFTNVVTDVSQGSVSSHPIIRSIYPHQIFFAGDSVALYGPVGPYAASNYGVRLDNSTLQRNFSANRQFYRSQQLLYFAGNLGDGVHSVELSFLGLQTEELAIDFANIYAVAAKRDVGGSLDLAVVFGLAFSSTVAGLSAISLFLIFLRYRFGWFPFLAFVKPRKAKSKKPLKDCLPSHTTEQSSPPVLQGNTAPQSGGSPSILALTEISEYPFSTSDYYVRTDYSQSVPSQSPRPLSGLTETTSSSKSSKSRGTKKKKYTHPYMIPIAEA